MAASMPSFVAAAMPPLDARSIRRNRVESASSHVRSISMTSGRVDASSTMMHSQSSDVCPAIASSWLHRADSGGSYTARTIDALGGASRRERRRAPGRRLEIVDIALDGIAPTRSVGSTW